MAYTLQFNKTDTLAATLNSGATSTTLTTGNFGSPSGTQIYVVDYDVPAKAEIISASITTTAVTGVTRGLTGGAAGTTDHAIGAKIASIFVPQHYLALVDGSGFSTGTTSVGIPAAATKQEAWTSWTPTYSASGSLTYIGVTTTYAKYIRVGNTVHFQLQATGTTGGVANNGIRFTLPVTAAGTSGCFAAYVDDAQAQAGAADFFSTSIVQVIKYDASNFALGATRIIKCSGSYEVA